MSSCLRERFSSLPLLAILRGIKVEEVTPVAEIALRCAVPALEVTLNTPAAYDRIREFKLAVGHRMAIGAGTVLDLQGMEAALHAGAEFLVSPVCIPEVAAECRRRKIPYFPGALTPQEVWNAWKSGAEMVKVFPAGAFGPLYFSELKGPFDSLRLMAVGGVDAANVSQFLSQGAEAVACGGSVFRRTWLEEGRFDLVESELIALANAIRSARP